MSPSGPPTDLPIHFFRSADAWQSWLDQYHAGSDGIYLRIAKKAADLESVGYPEVLDIALCYGWIDGVRLRGDDETYLQRFTPRTRRSVWSRINRDKAEALIEAGEMRPAGLAEVERARADGRWEKAYEPASSAKVPPDLEAALQANPKAAAFFETLTGSNRYAILYRLHSAKREETRQRRLQQFMEMLERGEKIYP